MIDPSIPLSVKGFDFAGSFANGQSLRMNQMKMQEAQQELADKRLERQTYAQMFANPQSMDPANRQQTIGQIGQHNPELAFKLQQHFATMDKQSRDIEKGKWDAAAPVLQALQNVPVEQRPAYLQHAAPMLMASGWTNEDLQKVDLSDQSIHALATTAQSVQQVLDSQKIDWHPVGENGSFATDAMGNPTGSGNPFAPGAAPAPQRVGDLFGSLIQQESGGRPGVTGPQTPYGQAQGMTQMLPSTAHAMADKLHMPWQPEMMTGKTPEAAQYQQTLGKAYLDEGLEKFGGDPQKALMYYHGGPNQALWGPKTHAYADNVMSRASGGQDKAAILKEANDAIARGADRAKVTARLRAMGVVQ